MYTQEQLTTMQLISTIANNTFYGIATCLVSADTPDEDEGEAYAYNLKVEFSTRGALHTSYTVSIVAHYEREPENEDALKVISEDSSLPCALCNVMQSPACNMALPSVSAVGSLEGVLDVIRRALIAKAELFLLSLR